MKIRRRYMKAAENYWTGAWWALSWRLDSKSNLLQRHGIRALS